MVHRRCLVLKRVLVIGKRWLGLTFEVCICSFHEISKKILRTFDFHEFWEVEALCAGARVVFLDLEVRLWNYRYTFDLGYIKTTARSTVRLLKLRGRGNG